MQYEGRRDERSTDLLARGETRPQVDLASGHGLAELAGLASAVCRVCVGLLCGVIRRLFGHRSDRRHGGRCSADCGDTGGELESAHPYPGPVVLPPDQGVSSRTRRGDGRQASEAGIDRCEEREEPPEEEAGERREDLGLSTDILGLGEYLSLRHRVPRRGRVEFMVESNVPVTTFVVDEDGLQEFEEGEEVSAWGGFHNRRLHQDKLTLPFRGNWWLLIVNESRRNAAVHYEVYYRN